MGAEYWLTRFWFQRGLGLIYCLGFLIALNQFRALSGLHGLLPVPLYLKHLRFWDAPSLFHYYYSDRFFMAVSAFGLFLALLALTGISDSFGMALSVAVWFLLWALYLSIVNVGQTFYGFGWETLLLETGFLAIFLGPTHSAPPAIVIWLLRWLLFRVIFGAGMIKLRGDACWRDLTCMYYHYETQPLPNPLSWYFHHQPAWFHKLEVLFNHFVELVVPWFYFAPRPIVYFAGGLTVLFQAILILSGNLSWLNYITILLCIPCFDDAFFSHFPAPVLPGPVELSVPRLVVLGLLTLTIVIMSYAPARNLFSPRQMMNASFEPFHIVNTYGAFGSITRERMEVVLEGTDDPSRDAGARWREYEFKGKPGDVMRRPAIVSPYHWKLDWQMWFAAMSPYWQHPWILNLVAKLLEGDAPTLALMGKNPFPEKPPKYIRARLYRYEYTKPGEKGWWKRRYEDEYLPPLSLEDPEFRRILSRMGWE